MPGTNPRHVPSTPLPARQLTDVELAAVGRAHAERRQGPSESLQIVKRRLNTRRIR
jgi:hypothetical protein